MELDLFQFIDEAVRLYDLHHASFEYAEGILKEHFLRFPEFQKAISLRSFHVSRQEKVFVKNCFGISFI